MKFEVSAIVLGVIQAIKMAGFPAKYAPLLAPILGALCNVFLLGFSPESVVNGLGFGLMAVGLYEGANMVTARVQFGDDEDNKEE